MGIKSKLIRIKSGLKNTCLRILYKNDRIVSVFIALCGDYDRQSRSIVRGIIGFNTSVSGKYALYRRNIHRIEKGLVMIPRRSIFARDFIYETVKLHQSIANNIDSEQLEWGTNVLIEYFDVVKQGDKKVDTARELFKTCIIHSGNLKGNSKKPIEVKENALIDSAQFLKFVSARKSTRWFEDREVDHELIVKSVEIASQAPSACNRQPFKFYYCSGDDAARISKLAMGSAGFSHNIKNLMVVVGEQGSFNMLHDRNVIYVDSSLSVMQLLLGFETLGLSSCVLNWPDVKSRDIKISKELDLTDTQKVICLVAFGYAQQGCLTPYSEKKTEKELLVIN